MAVHSPTGDDALPVGIGRFVPIVAWLPRYERAWLRSDLLAGLSVWAILVPTSLGYATLSGVPAQHGLYAAAAGMIAFALFTTSRHVVLGPSSSTAPVLGVAVVGFAAAGSKDAVLMAAAITLVAALMFIVLAALKMGWVSKFLSSAVLTGLSFGVAIDVAAGELFTITGTKNSGSNTWTTLWSWVAELPQLHRPTVVVGVVALVLLFALKLLAPRVPGALITVALGIVATIVFDLQERGVALIPAVPRGLPTPAVPDITLIADRLPAVVGAAVGLVLIGFSVTTAAVRQYATKHNYRVDINQELLAQGMSNASSSLFQGMFVNGSLSKSPVNDSAGAKSQVSTLVQAALIILTLVFLAPVFSDLPQAVLGAIIIEAVVMGMMNVHEMKRLLRVQPFEFATASAALLGVMTFGILQGVFIGVGLSILWLVARSALPHIPELGRKPGTDAFYDLAQGDDFETFPGTLVLRFDGGLFFVNADALGDRLHRIRTESAQQLSAVILSMEGVDFIDTEGADVLKKLATADAVQGIDLRLARVKPSVERVLARDGFFDVISRDHLHDTIEEAVDAHLALHPAPSHPGPDTPSSV